MTYSDSFVIQFLNDLKKYFKMDEIIKKKSLPRYGSNVCPHLEQKRSPRKPSFKVNQNNSRKHSRKYSHARASVAYSVGDGYGDGYGP